MIYFTADTHFGSRRAMLYGKRPYKNAKKMDKQLIKGWNKKVNKGDIVYHLVDFGDYNLIKKLNGNVILILGNYEKNDEKQFDNFDAFRNYLVSLGFENVFNERGLVKTFKNITEKPIKLVHKPTDCDFDKFNLFGHIHGSVRVKRFGLNVGVDCHNFRPISEKEVSFYKNAIENVYTQDVFITKNDLTKN